MQQILMTVDLTTIEPGLKQSVIFERFDQLDSDGYFIIMNDQNPEQFYRELLDERGNLFSWDYLQNGPDSWKVRIARSSIWPLTTAIGEIVAKDYRKADVFKKFNLDFCCGGKKTLSEACKEKNVNLSEVENELKMVDLRVSPQSCDYDDWDLDFLTEYILNTHHKYVKRNIPILMDYTAKVSNVHGQNHPEVTAIAQKFREAASELIDHMAKEENILFPYIMKLVRSHRNGIKLPFTSRGAIQNPVNMMEHEHEFVGNLFKQIRELSDNYTPPEKACTTYKISYLKLKEFEDDLHQHIHLENNILFPKSIQLENNN